MGIFDVWIGWFLLFPILHIAISLPSSFCSRRYIVRKMLDEKLQDGCLEHGHMWCVNGVSLAISESPWCLNLPSSFFSREYKPSIKFLLKTIYCSEDVGWKIAGWLFRAWPYVMCEWSEFSYFWISMMPKPSIKFFLKRIYGLEDVEEIQDGCLVQDHLLYLSGMKEPFLSLLLALRIQSGFCSRGHMVWRKTLFEKFQDGCIVHGHLWCVNGVILAISESPYCEKPPINFLIKKIYGSEEDVGWRIPGGCIVHSHLWCENWLILAFSESLYCRKPPTNFLITSIYSLEEDVGWWISRWLFSAWPSLKSEWGDFSYFLVSILPK